MKILLVLLLICSPVAAANCLPENPDYSARVSYINDGDTFELNDGRRVRFIGINAPEIGRDGQPSEPYAQTAYKALKNLLQHSQDVILQYGHSKKDRYNRILAHVFLADGTNISEWLLHQGLALRIAIPPNLWGQDCYARAEQQAREQKRGLWSQPITKAGQLNQTIKGFHYVEGEIRRIGHSKKSIWLNFNGPLSIRIARKDIENFHNIDFNQLKNRRVRVRGWAYNYKKENIIRLRHSSMLEIMK